MNRLTYLLPFIVILVAAMVPVLAQIPEVSPLVLTEPTDVGGTILDPGIYTIRVVPLNTSRNILQVTNEDQSEVLVSVLSVPHALPPSQRDSMSAEFVYYSATEYTPRALRSWFAPDPASDGGHDIVYPESRAMEIAAASRESVVAYAGEVMTEPELETATLETVTPDRQVQPFEPAPAESFATLSEDREPQIAEGREAIAMEGERELPQTAGRAPLLALVGLLSLVAAFGVRRMTAA